jgi:hypothetical protein
MMLLVNTTRTKALYERNGQVYVGSINGAKDVDGWPMDARWESSIEHFRRYEHLWIAQAWSTPAYAFRETI